MKLVTFRVQTVLGRFQRLGALLSDAGGSGTRILDLNTALFTLLSEQGKPGAEALANVTLPPAMRPFIEMDEQALDAARLVLEACSAGRLPKESPAGAQLLFQLTDVVLEAPLPNPNSLRDFLAFETHTKSGFDRRGQEMPTAWYEMPVYYKGNHRAIIGPDRDVEWPFYTEKMDYELELACIVGKAGRNISAESAAEHIFGYTIMNDFSARDIQREETTCRLGPAKGKDFATAIGPYILTKDEIGDVRNLRMTARINGEVWSDGNSGTSSWSFEEMIAHVSMDETLYPSDILGSGTVGGGCGLELDRWLAPGDTVELSIEGLGALQHRIIRTPSDRQYPILSKKPSVMV